MDRKRITYTLPPARPRRDERDEWGAVNLRYVFCYAALQEKRIHLGSVRDPGAFALNLFCRVMYDIRAANGKGNIGREKKSCDGWTPMGRNKWDVTRKKKKHRRTQNEQATTKQPWFRRLREVKRYFDRRHKCGFQVRDKAVYTVTRLEKSEPANSSPH